MSPEKQNIDFELISHSTDQTIQLGREIGNLLQGGEVFCFIGTLGSGKTHLIKGIAQGAGAPSSQPVNSPTFVIVNEYLGQDSQFDIYHIDAYRIDSITEFEMLGFDDLCYPQSIVLIEWADKVQSALKEVDYIQIKMSHYSENQRKILLENIPHHLTIALKT